VKTIVVGAGINGVTAAVELRKRGHEVSLVDPGPLPYPLAASTDISKAVRAAYGADEDYAELAERSIQIWREWNAQFGVELYHETGFLFMRRTEMQPGDFEFESFMLLKGRGHKVERIDSALMRKRFPAWNAELYPDGFLDHEAGYAESGRVVAQLVAVAKSCGVLLRENCRFADLDANGARVQGIVLDTGEKMVGDAVVMATGAWTPYTLSHTKKFFRATGHPVFHLRPRHPELFAPERFPVFGADISMTGYYGFPLNRDGVVKVANHGPGREMSPDSPDRVVTTKEETAMRNFLLENFPALADAPIVYTRICLYCDTNDGDFWIAPDPEHAGLMLAAGDSGHGFKFAPVLGEIIADAVEEKANPLLQKFRWRPEVERGVEKEAGRYLPDAS
jgi:glycine/D-amino acid oxidase-like deaminating enzyme